MSLTTTQQGGESPGKKSVYLRLLASARPYRKRFFLGGGVHAPRFGMQRGPSLASQKRGGRRPHRPEPGHAQRPPVPPGGPLRRKGHRLLRPPVPDELGRTERGHGSPSPALRPPPENVPPVSPRKPPREIMSRITNDVTILQNLVTSVVVNLWSSRSPSSAWWGFSSISTGSSPSSPSPSCPSRC